jgi:hypothetical protein
MARKPGAARDEAARVKEAVEEARQLVSRLIADVVSWNDAMSPETEHIAAVALLESILCDPAANRLLDKLTPVVRKKALPAIRRARPPIRRRRGKPAQSIRNAWITEMVATICRRGFDATRNDATEKECACSIIATAFQEFRRELQKFKEAHPESRIDAKTLERFELGETGIARIWSKRSNYKLP